jgi:hypothetical protein
MIDKMSGNPVPPGAMPNKFDPVSGNEVPLGSSSREVRDNIPIMASENEYVLPADVVRYIGLDKIEKMVNSAKEGIEGMGQQGRIGGEPPAPAPQGAPMFNTGGLVTNTTNPSRGILEGVSEFDSKIPFAFNPAPYLGGFDPSGHVKIYQYRGPNGEVMFIPTNNNGQPLFSPPEGYTQVGGPTEAPVQEEAPAPQEERSPMWSDGLTPEQITQEQQNRTFRTAEQINAPVSTGQNPLSGLMSGISGVFSKLTSNEMFGGIVQAIATIGLGAAGGQVVGMMIDNMNKQREKEGKPPVAVEEVTTEAAKAANVPITVQELRSVADSTTASPTQFRSQKLPDGTQTFQRAELGFGSPNTPQNPRGSAIEEAATQRGALEAEGYVVLGEMGTANDPRFLVQSPDGTVSTIKPGDEVGGATFRGIRQGIGDPVGSALREVGIFEGALKEPPAGMPRGVMDPRESALGRNSVGLPSTSRSGTSLPTPSSAGSSGLTQRPSAGLGSTPVSFDGGSDSSGMTDGVGRTGTGSGSVSGAFSGQYGSTSPSSQSSVGRSMGTPVSANDPKPSAGFSMGTPVSTGSTRDTRSGGFTSDQQAGRAPSFNKGGLVGSPKSNYNILQSYKKGGLVTRKK